MFQIFAGGPGSGPRPGQKNRRKGVKDRRKPGSDRRVKTERLSNTGYGENLMRRKGERRTGFPDRRRS